MIDDECSTDQLAKERGDGTPLLHIVAGSPSFPLAELSDRQFERLTYDLLASACSTSDLSTDYDRATLLREGADRARDILLYRERKLVGIVQCKRRSDKMSLSAITRELLKYCLFSVRSPELVPMLAQPFGYQLWTAGEISEAARAFFDDCAISHAELAQLTQADVDKARGGVKALSIPEDPLEARAEAAQVLQLARRLPLTHVGPAEIHLRLRHNDPVRRGYFRSPEDGPPRATVAQIDGLLRKRHALALELLADAGAAGDHPYVPREELTTAFGGFLGDPARLFVVVGGSGQGKTSWAARLTETPPANWSVELVRAEDIGSGDRDVIDTLRHELEKSPLDGVPSAELGQALWDWVDAANRIFVVDGLDRARREVQEGLAAWLRRSEGLTRRFAVRVVLTSRGESWARLARDLAWQTPRLFAPDRSDRSVSLGPLSSREAPAYYAAYGVYPTAHRGRHLASPALIRRFANLRKAQREAVVTRCDVISADFDVMLDEAAAAPYANRVQAELVIRAMGCLLSNRADGWVTLADLCAEVAGATGVLDALLRSDRATTTGGNIRLESDDMIEMVIGRALSEETALGLLRRHDCDALAIGGLAMMVALAERDSTMAARALLDAWLDEIPRYAPSALDAVARALMEVRAPDQFIAQIESVVASWHGHNLMLGSSQLGEMISALPLPAAQRLALIWPLAANEEADDWRTKYWFDPDLQGRIRTAFVPAAESAAREGGGAVLEFLARQLDDADPATRAVAVYLFHIAAHADPTTALNLAWGRPHDPINSPLAITTSSAPGPTVRFLASEAAATAHLAELVHRVYAIACESPIGPRPNPASADDVLHAVDSLLPRAENRVQEVHLLIAALRHGDDARQHRLIALWDHVPNQDYWRAVALTGTDQERLLIALLDGDDVAHDRENLLCNMWHNALDIAGYRMVFTRLEALYRREPTLGQAIARAAEGMLYAVPPDADEHGMLTSLGLALAGDTDEKVRLPLLFYAGSPQRGHPDAADVARRERIFTRLVEAEDGASLDTLMWKLAESAEERGVALDHAMNLVDRLGLEAVLSASRKTPALPYVKSLRQEIERRARTQKCGARSPR